VSGLSNRSARPFVLLKAAKLTLLSVPEADFLVGDLRQIVVFDFGWYIGPLTEHGSRPADRTDLLKLDRSSAGIGIDRGDRPDAVTRRGDDRFALVVAS
jgi:hypothetical protein